MNIKNLIFAASLALAVGPADSLAAAAETPGVAAKAGDDRSDSALTTRVKAVLLGEKNLKSLPISVESTDGVVTLSGDVVSSAQAERAVDVTKHVEGVKGVHDALELKTDAK
jgi:osmotically-inducible protein OsmY